MPVPSQTRPRSTHLAKVVRKVAAWLEERQIVRAGLLVGVSGGADSVGLLRAVDACRQSLGLNVRVAHLDHGLRAESAEDARWVERLAGQLGLPVVCERADVQQLATQTGQGIEQTAREARYEFFRRAATAGRCSYVAVAHTADDQTETILHHVIRGTGLAGLRGMPELRPVAPGLTLVRPLLGVTRSDVLDFLDELQQDCRTDASNDDEQFTRNRLRHTLLPLLRDEFNPQVGEALARLGRQAGEVHQLVENLSQGLLASSLVERQDDRVVLACPALQDADRHLVREALRQLWTNQQWPRQRMGFDDWDRLAELAQSGQSSKSLDLPHGMRAERRGSHIELQRAVSR